MPDPAEHPDVEGLQVSPHAPGAPGGSAIADELGRRIAAGKIELPVPPEAAARIIAAARREDADLVRVTELVRRDPALAAHVLGIANSALFASPTPIVSLQQAVFRLGLDGLRKAAFVVAGRSAMLRVLGHDDVVRRVYRHSLLAAAFAQELARSRRLNVEEAFLCGLLHDVGRPVLWHAASDIERAAGRAPGRGHAAAHAEGPPEQAGGDPVAAAIDQHHAAAGAAVLAAWPAGADVADVVRHHHDPEPPAPAARMVLLIALADRLAQAAAEPDSDAVPELPTAALAALAFYPEDIDSLWQRRADIRAFARDLA